MTSIDMLKVTKIVKEIEINNKKIEILLNELWEIVGFIGQNTQNSDKEKENLSNKEKVTQKENTLSKEKEIKYILNDDKSLDIYNSNKNNNIDSNTNNKKRFVKPTIQEVKDYVILKGKNVDWEAFWHFYESKNWFIGKNKMVNWHSAVATWERSNKNKVNPKNNLTNSQLKELQEIVNNKQNKLKEGWKI